MIGSGSLVRQFRRAGVHENDTRRSELHDDVAASAGDEIEVRSQLYNAKFLARLLLSNDARCQAVETEKRDNCEHACGCRHVSVVEESLHHPGNSWLLGAILNTWSVQSQPVPGVRERATQRCPGAPRAGVATEAQRHRETMSGPLQVSSSEFKSRRRLK